MYTRGYISYPRTETTHYHDNFDLKSPVTMLARSNEWGEYSKQLLSDGINKARKGKDAGDHPPITPMQAASYQEIGLFVFIFDLIK